LSTPPKEWTGKNSRTLANPSKAHAAQLLLM
jgi:hypothetical protein